MIPAKVFGFYGILTISNHPGEMTKSPPRGPQPWTRRMSDKLRLVFHAACDEGNFSVAEQRLNQLCKHTAASSISPSELDKRKPENLRGVCERLSNLLLWQVEKHAEPATQRDEDPLSR